MDRRTICFSLNLLLACLVGNIYQSKADRVLCVAVQQVSHVSEVIGVAEKLTNYGHELYLALSSNYPNQERYTKKGFKVINYHIPSDEVLTASPEYQSMLRDAVLSGEFDSLEKQNKIPEFAWRDCNYMMKDNAFIDSVKALDISLIIADGFIICDCNLILPAHLNIPFVAVSSTYHPLHVNIPALPSFAPSIIGRYSEKMSFIQRLKNIMDLFLVLNPPFQETSDTTLLEKYAPQYSSWKEVRTRALLFFQTRDYHLEWPIPIMPNFIMLPGLSAVTSYKGLSSDMLSLIEANPKGVIIMTFGSMFAQLSDEIIVKFLDAFGKLEQTVVWRLRLEPRQSFDIPKNVFLKSWLPQGELLAHPNAKLFITHCGNGGQHEAVYNGVPMLGFPLFAEQPHNIHRAVEHGIALEMNILSFTTEELLLKINKLLTDPQYRENTLKLSAILKDRPMTSQDEAAYWVNHVMKHGGAHLRSHVIDMSWFEILMLDIVAVFLLAIVVTSYILYLITRMLCNNVFKQKKQKTL